MSTIASRVTGIHIDGTENNAAICCTFDGARFHLWFDPTTGRQFDDVLYKNSLALKRSEEGYFDTRKLSQSKGVGRDLAPLLLNEATKLLPAFLQRLSDEEAKRRADNTEAIRIAHIKEHGVTTLAALERAEKFFAGGMEEAGFDPTNSEDRKVALKIQAELDNMRAAIATAKGVA